MVTALIIVIGTMGLQMSGVTLDFVWYILLGVGYACAIAALILDFAKIRPIVRTHQQRMTTGKKSPKQIKHETEAATFALELEKAREAEKAAKKGSPRGGAFKKQPRIIEAKSSAELTDEAIKELLDEEQPTKPNKEQPTKYSEIE